MTDGVRLVTKSYKILASIKVSLADTKMEPESTKGYENMINSIDRSRNPDKVLVPIKNS